MKKMCGQCPWNNKAAPGWLGDATVEEFVAQAQEGESRMPCHMSVDYNDPAWGDNLANKRQCAGVAQARNKSCKIPRDPAIAKHLMEVKDQDNHMDIEDFKYRHLHFLKETSIERNN